MLNYVFRGQTVTTKAEFLNADNSPFVVSNPVTYTVYDFNNNVVVSDTAIQDTLSPQTWIATFAIPVDVPIPELNEKYKIVWLASNNNESKSAIEYFSIREENDPFFYEYGKLALNKGKLADSLVTQEEVSNISLRLIDENDREIHKANVNQQPVVNRDNFIYNYESSNNIPDLIPGNGVCPYFAEWTYTSPTNGMNVEVHPIYVVNTKMFMFIDGVRKMVDKARNNDINPALEYHDLDLAHYVLDGIQRINAHAPNVTSWTPSNIPTSIYPFVKKAGAIEALRAQYLAEGVNAFDFTGQSVTLNIDRTQYIQSVMDNLEQSFDEPLRKTKKILIRRSGPGALHITINPTTNFAYRHSPRDALALYHRRFLP